MSTKPLTMSSTLLKPFASFLLFEWSGSQKSKPIADRLAMLLKSIRRDFPPGLTFVANCGITQQTPVAMAAFYLQETSRPAWTKDKSVIDIAHHFVALLDYGDILGVVVSNSSVRTYVEHVLIAQAGLEKLSSDELENALVRETPLRTLWLRSAHRRNRSKADSKVLTGQYLQDALSPLDDRTFTSSSMRAEAKLRAGARAAVVGVTTERSYVWLGPTQTVDELQDRFKELVDYLVVRRGTRRKAIPVLAQALNNAPGPGTVSEAFDFAFVSPEATAMLDPKMVDVLEQFEAQLGINTVGKADQNFSLLITDEAQANSNSASGDWQVNIEVKLGGVKALATATLDSNSTQWTRWGDFKNAVDTRHLWAVWYQSGQSLADGSWISVDPRASTYDGNITSVTFDSSKWNVSEEKPLNGKQVLWNEIGKPTDKSLFSWWIQEGYSKCFPGAAKTPASGEFAITICDDGAGEIGDFLVLAKHPSFATSTNPSNLALIIVHMKGASKSTNRGMAPKQYEEVLGQATKNLSWIRFPDLRNDLQNDLKAGKNLLWEWSSRGFQQVLTHKQNLPLSSSILTQLDDFDGRRFHTHVVVVQPHQEASKFQAAMNSKPVDYKTRLLCTLLCAAEGACRSSSATLQIVMSK